MTRLNATPPINQHMPYVVENADGTTRLLLPDLPAVAMYITRTDSTPRVLHSGCQLWPVWHGRKERRHDAEKLDDVLNELRRRVKAMQAAGVCTQYARWHHESTIFNDCHPKGWKP